MNYKYARIDISSL